MVASSVVVVLVVEVAVVVVVVVDELMGGWGLIKFDFNDRQNSVGLHTAPRHTWQSLSCWS